MKNIRIEKIAEMVKEGMIVADIGTDHAYLPVLLMQQKKCKKVYACDVAKGPLEAANKTIEKANLSASITTILSNGFDTIPNDIEGAVIAGMGFMTATMILEKAQNRLDSLKQIIVEINRDTTDMRQWISQHQYTIDDEAYVNDRNHDYVIISFTTKKHELYTEEEILLGPILMQQKNESYISYCQKQLAKKQAIYQKNKDESLLREIEIYQKYL